MKRKTKKLSIEKLVIATLSNTNTIRGGYPVFGTLECNITSVEIRCLTTRIDEPGNTDNCESRGCAGW